MVKDSRAAAGAGGLRLLNQPKPTAIEATSEGEPKSVVVHGRFQPVRAILDSWRIDDEWWREEIARRYFAVELQNGRTLTVYHDLVGGGWFTQGYDGPRDGKSMVRAERPLRGK